MKKTKEKKTKIKTIRNLKWEDFFYPIAFIVFAFISNIIGHLWIDMSAIPKYFMLDFAIVMLIAAGIFALPSIKGRKIVTYIFVVLAIGINITNACLYKVFGDVFHVQMLFLMEEAVSAFDLSYFDFLSILANLLLLASFISVSIFFTKRAIKKERYYSKPKYVQVLCAFIIQFALFVPVLNIAEAQIKNPVHATSEELIDMTTDEFLYDNLLFKYSSLEKFGSYSFYFKEFINAIFNINYKTNSAEKQELQQYLIDSHKSTDETTNAGVLKDDNLICILTESLEWFAIDPYYTPTLYDMYENNSVCLTNYFSKNKTNVSEGIVNFGSMPSCFNLKGKTNGKTLNNPYTLANMLKARDYSAKYFHSFSNALYNRTEIMPALGYDSLDFFTKANVGYDGTNMSNLGSDYDFVVALEEKMMPTEGKFFTSYATMSTHSTYDNLKKHIKRYLTVFDDEETFENFKQFMISERSCDIDQLSKADYNYFINYKLGAIDLDRAIAKMLQLLEEKSLLNNTTLVLFSDHNAYGNGIGNTMKDINKQEYYKTEVYRVPACIYSKKLTPQKIDKFTNSYDLYRTITALFDLDYNEAICNGYNVFDNEIDNSFFASFTSGIMKNDLYSKDFEKVYTTSGDIVTDETIKQEFINEINKFYNKQYRIDKVYKNNILANYEIVIGSGGESYLALK